MVNSYMRSLRWISNGAREWVRLVFDVYTPLRQFRLDDEFPFRTYKAEQFGRLLSRVEELELVEMYDFTYDIDQPIEIHPRTEDVIYILRKK